MMAFASAFLLGGCALMTGGATEVTLPGNAEGARPLPVKLIPASSVVTGLEPPPADVALDPPDFEGIGGLEGRPNAVLVRWIGGACDERVEIAAGGPGSTVTAINLRTWVRPGGCDLVAFGRGVVVTFAVPVESDEVGLSIERCVIGEPNCQ